MTPRWLNIALAAVFLIVGIVAANNMIRLNDYVRETLPRDTEQEVCQLATLQALRVWAVGRGQISDAESALSTTLEPWRRAIEKGEPPSPEVAAHVDAAFQHVQQVRAQVSEMLTAAPIPTCRLLGAAGKP